MSHHFARSIGVAASMVQVAMPAAGSGLQRFGARSCEPEEYQVAIVRDRLTDSTRVVASFTGSSRQFGLSSQAWLGVSFSFPGARLLAPPVRTFAKGRGEMRWYDIPSQAFARLAGAPELIFTVGRARFHVRDRMEMFREVVRRMTPSARGWQ